MRRVGRRTTGGLPPSWIAIAYELPQVNATRQPVIGILELGGGYRDSDNAAAFEDMAQVVPAIANVSVGSINAPGDAADGEVALDVQVAGGICQSMANRQCKIVMAWASNDGGTSFAAAIDGLVDEQVDAISISWGAAEDQWTAQDRAAVANAIDRANAAGIPVFVASGDADAGDGEPGANVDFPASYPGAIGCGGTTLIVGPEGYVSERAWNDGRGDGTGGGFSRYYLRPAWQTTSRAARGVPDVCGPADPSGPGWRIVLNGVVQVIGGTSAVAPMWAGIIAACKAAGYGGKYLAQLLYANPQALRDVVAGDNSGYSASTGWDPCTGLGSPNGPELVRLLLGATTSTPPAAPSPPSPAGPAPIVGSGLPTGPTLAEAQTAAIQGIEDTTVGRPFAAPIMRECEPNVKARLAALWQSKPSDQPQGESMPLETKPRSLQSILTSIQAGLVAIQQLLPVLQEVLDTVGKLPLQQPPSPHMCAEEHCRKGPTHPRVSPRIDPSTISTDLAQLQAAQATLVSDQAALASAQSSFSTAEALVTTVQGSVTADAATVAGLVKQTIADIQAVYGPPAS